MRVRAAAGFAVLLSCAAGAAFAAPPNRLVAVLEVRNHAKAPIGDRLAWAERVRTALRERLEGTHVITREEMQLLAQENPRALDRCNDEDCVEVGKLLGADVVVEARLDDASRGALALSLRAVDVRSARLIGSARAIRKTAQELLGEVDRTAAPLARRIARTGRPGTL